MVCNQILVKKKDPLVCLNFGKVCDQILVKQKDPTVSPEIRYDLQPNSCQKKKDPPICFEF